MSKSQRLYGPTEHTIRESRDTDTSVYPQSQRHSGDVAADEDREVYAEQVRQLYSNSMPGLLASAINALLIVVIQRSVTPHSNLIVWIALLAVISLLRYRDIRAYWREPPEAAQAARWGKRFAIGLALSGVAWGSAAIFLFPVESLAHETFLAFVVGGMVAGAAAAFSSIMTAFLAYSVPALTPIIVHFALLGDELRLAMGGMTLLFGIMMFVVAQRVHTVRIASVRLRFQNRGLVCDLTEQSLAKEALKKARDELEGRVRERTAELNNAYEVLQVEVEERRKVEKELRLLTTAIEQAVEGVFVNAPDGTIVYANKAFCRMLGYREEELIGQRIWKTRADDSGQSSTLIWATINAGNVWTGRITRRRKDGGLIETETSVGPIKDDTGKVINQVGVCRDITGQLRLEDQLRQAQKMEALGTLAGGIAHDFNNILAAMLGFTEMVIEDVSDRPDVQHKMERVLKAGLRGRDLVKQILAFSRNAEGELKELSLTSLIRETHALLRASLPSIIEMRLAVDTKDDCVLGEPTQLQQVIMNLVTNAAYAMRENGGLLTTRLSSTTFPERNVSLDPDMKPGTYVKLTVSDTGTGMTDEVRERIFEPFFTTKEPGQGTGMGLAVAYGIVKSHGGTITAQSQPGQGSTFEVFLPQAQKPRTTKEAATTDAPLRGTERILFVDDEELLVEMVSQVLGDLGYHVTTARNGSEAWDLFREDPSEFDLVITDQTMPDMSGMSLAQKMLKVRKELPVILCTGHSETVSPETAHEVGISAFAMKPVLKRELAETVRRVLDGAMVRI
ncbi:MAG TPA: ATP-binding protein [Syntrophorhabdales bacterium]|nr:ATP-binding protein [Syntrophorhabdales bacterium]